MEKKMSLPSDAPSLPTVAAGAENPAAPLLPKQEQTHLTYRPNPEGPLEADVRRGVVVIGKLSMFKRWGSGLYFVKSRLFPCDVVLNTNEARGAALHGDVVAVLLAPREQWQAQQQQSQHGGGDTDDSPVDFDVDQVAPMPTTLPDGRRVVRALKKESEASRLAHLPVEQRLVREMDGPEHYDWPAGVSPTGSVAAILHREMDLFHVGRIAPNARSGPSEPIKGGYLYRFRLYNPLLPLAMVAGNAIPPPFHAKVENHLFLLKLKMDEQGNVFAAHGDMLSATIHSSLGMADSVAANTAAICAAHGIKPETFPDEIEALVPDSLDIPVTREGVEAMGRRDLREEEFVCTIDPATARDLDDALSICRTASGGYRVGVHIADVSFFVEPGTALDEEAQWRSTSTYFVDHVVPMLPRLLSEKHCSLNPNEDKLAFSSVFELDRAGHVVSEWFGRSVIRSRCRLAYEQAQEIIDGKEIELVVDPAASTARLKKRVHDSVRLLYEVASMRRKESLARGRLTIGSLRLSFLFDDMNSQLAPRGFFVKRQIEANWVVEEFMLLANNRTAEKIVQFIPDGAMLRRHLPPKAKKMHLLSEGLKRCDIEFKGSSARMLQETLDACKGHPHYDSVCEMLKFSLQAAAYFANDVKDETPRFHFALGLPWYTHFTSPIRRYCDIMAHRQLIVALELEKVMREKGMELPSMPDDDVAAKPGADPFNAAELLDPETLEYSRYHYPQSEVNAIAEVANAAKEDARQAGEESVQLFFCMYLQALFKKAEVDSRIAARQFTPVSIVKLTGGSMLLFSAEIASQVEVGLADTKQRFTVVKVDEDDAEEGEGDDGDGTAAAKKTKKDSSRCAVPVDGSGRAIDVKAKAARRLKGGKQGMPGGGGAAEAGGVGSGGTQNKNEPPASILVLWQDPDKVHEDVSEEFGLFSQLVAELILTVKKSRICLDMVILPPWEREAYLRSGAKVPTSLE